MSNDTSKEKTIVKISLKEKWNLQKFLERETQEKNWSTFKIANTFPSLDSIIPICLQNIASKTPKLLRIMNPPICWRYNKPVCMGWKYLTQNPAYLFFFGLRMAYRNHNYWVGFGLMGLPVVFFFFWDEYTIDLNLSSWQVTSFLSTYIGMISTVGWITAFEWRFQWKAIKTNIIFYWIIGPSKLH